MRNKRNLQGGNIKRAIEEVAKGGYIAIQHSDDIWELNKLEKQVAFLDQNPNIGAVFTNVRLIDELGLDFTDSSHFYFNRFIHPNRTRFEWLRHFFYIGNALCHPSILIRKTCYSNSIYRNGMSQLPDLDMWVQLCLSHDIHVIQEKLVRFRVRNDEANQSGDKPETRIRIRFELLQTLSQYKNIRTIDELTKIFPEGNEYTHEKYSDIHYTLGMVAVNYGNNNQTRLFGLNLLFDALNDPERASKLRKYHGFTKKEFVKLSGENDVFSIEEIRNLKNQILLQQQKILYYANSKSWRLTKPIRRLVGLFSKNHKENLY
jgi:hypothetical protein